MKNPHVTYAAINGLALQHNLKVIRNIVQGSKIIAMIKANAYGHGLLQVANYLSNADMLGVSCTKEALNLRNNGINTPIIVMHGIYSENDLKMLSQHNCQIVIHDFWQIDLMESISIPSVLKLWIRVNIDSDYIGFCTKHLKQIYEQLTKHKNIICEGILAHFTNIVEFDREIIINKIDEFKLLTQDLECSKSLAGSNAIIDYPESFFDYVRPGTILYGMSLRAGFIPSKYDLKPVMSLHSQLISIKQLKKGMCIGYKARPCIKDTLVGIVPIGYGDGYPRNSSDTLMQVLVNGNLCQVIGHVSMDLLALDLNNCVNPRLGDEVIMWGVTPSIAQVANAAGTIPPELSCQLTNRIDMKFVYEEVKL